MEVAAVTTALVLIFGYSITRSMSTIKKHNHIDWDHALVNLVDGFNRWFCRVYHRLNADRLVLPESGGAIVVANHFSGLDPFLLIALSPRPLRFLIAREEYERFGLKWLFKAAGCIPVERETRPERALREAIKVLKKGEVVALFPHGRIHLDTDPPRKLKAGVVRLAELTACPVIPARIDGVKAKGSTVWGIILRAHANVSVCDPILCQPGEMRENLAKIALCIEKPTA